jgi:hypothetical protein
MICSNCGEDKDKYARDLCSKCYYHFYNNSVKKGEAFVKKRNKCTFCKEKFKEEDVIYKSLHKKCYVERKKLKKRNQYQIVVDAGFYRHRDEIKMILIKDKWNLLSPLDIYKVGHFYMMFKGILYKDFEFDTMSVEKQIPKMLSHLKKAYLEN